MHLWMARYREYGRASRLVGLWRSLLRRGIFSSIHLDPNSLVERQCERAPYLHDTPPLGRWDAGTVGRQEGSVKALSPVLLPPPTAPGWCRLPRYADTSHDHAAFGTNTGEDCLGV